MSPRAAWRLESLGFTEVYDYVAGKKNWGSFGLPRGGKLAEEPSAGDVARRDVPTCRLDERLGDVQERVRATGWDTAIVVNEEGVVLGRVGRRALASEEPDARVEEVMSPGPSTVRPSIGLEAIVERIRKANLTTAVITTPDGRLIGVLRLEDAERALGERGRA